MMPSRLKVVVAAIAGLLVLSASGAQARGFILVGSVSVDLTASAHPVSAATRDIDMAFHVDAVRRARTHAAATATASAICRGCSGEAVTVQVLYLYASPVMILDNVAVAWTQKCRSCRVTAVSLQVAVVRGRGSITPNNRALALNASCTRCHAKSGAYQLVVAGKGQGLLPASTIRQLRAWAADRARLLQAAPATRRTMVAQQHALGGVARLVNANLGTGTVAAHARVSGQ
jgi:hypothetical protein